MINLKRPLIIILDILIVLNIAFIWGNSLLPVKDSAALSSSVTEDILGLFGLDYEDLPISRDTMHKIIRKAAHMFEFFCLGLLFCLRLSKNSQKTAAATAFGLTVSVAILDELIQSFSDRACRVSDMLIDSCGGALGISLALLIMYFISKKNTQVAK